MTDRGHPRLGDGLAGAEREEAIEHLRRCEACRTEAASEDPARIFALLAARPIPQEILEQVSTRVAAAVRGAEALRPPVPSRRLRMASAWAAAAALAVALLLPLGGGTGRPSSDDTAAIFAPAASPRAGVQVVSSPGVSQVVDLTVGETQLVMIFDAGLDL
jgi:ferric-dicitrate binding protein FerR (iron transport regulator)